MTTDRLAERIQRETAKTMQRENTIIMVSEPDDREWQCIECGTVVEHPTRPKHCPNCNCVNGDFGPGVNVMAPREVVGWFE